MESAIAQNSVANNWCALHMFKYFFFKIQMRKKIIHYALKTLFTFFRVFGAERQRGKQKIFWRFKKNALFWEKVTLPNFLLNDVYFSSFFFFFIQVNFRQAQNMINTNSKSVDFSTNSKKKWQKMTLWFFIFWRWCVHTDWLNSPDWNANQFSRTNWKKKKRSDLSLIVSNDFFLRNRENKILHTHLTLRHTQIWPKLIEPLRIHRTRAIHKHIDIKLWFNVCTHDFITSHILSLSLWVCVFSVDT